MTTAAATVLVPVLDRPERVLTTLESIIASVGKYAVEILFLASPADEKEIAELRRVKAPFHIVWWPSGPGDFAKKINHGARNAHTDWVFTGADDLLFHPGWLDRCLEEHARTKALVIGTNDLGNPSVTKGWTATHLLVHRSYLPKAVVDQPGNLFCDLYSHNCVDTELVEVAKANRTWAFAAEAHVEHLHHVWGKSPDDATYRKGRSDHPADRRLFNSRRHLWVGRRVVRAHAPRVSSQSHRRR